MREIDQADAHARVRSDNISANVVGVESEPAAILE